MEPIRKLYPKHQITSVERLPVGLCHRLTIKTSETSALDLIVDGPIEVWRPCAPDPALQPARLDSLPREDVQNIVPSQIRTWLGCLHTETA
ncbi:MAG: hypothetical protein QNL12_09075, partial [Acidimicrobiia bacterium]|nr:hypothetical protein [Acidimicrobiia bacterium]MDX2467454.1 hypothetical protein [Acidimicrobiia bacterium]